jgi:hypothetical protein
MLLFDSIKGFPRGYPCLFERCPASEEWRWASGSIRNFPTWIWSRAWKDKLKTFKPLAPKSQNRSGSGTSFPAKMSIY